MVWEQVQPAGAATWEPVKRNFLALRFAGQQDRLAMSESRDGWAHQVNEHRKGGSSAGGSRGTVEEAAGAFEVVITPVRTRTLYSIKESRTNE